MCRFRTMHQVLLLMLMLLFGTAQSRGTEQGHGTVGMQGSIIDTPCAIAVNDIDQAVEMDVGTTGELIHDGQGPKQIFRIHLTGCTLKPKAPGVPDWNWFQITFDGMPDGGLFGVTGAGGIGVQIIDRDGHIARPGIPLPSVRLTPGEQVLEYTLQIRAAPHRLWAGDYQLTVRFKVDYF